MCGIVGYVGRQGAMPILLECLKRLEYRGYDSAGMGLISNGRLQVRRKVGSSNGLEALLKQKPVEGNLGIAHTRWATHGKPSDENAHPHTDCTGSVAVVHNGIIENYRALRSELEHEGHEFHSQTDTEVIAHALEKCNGRPAPDTMKALAGMLNGGYALGIISGEMPGKLMAMRNGGPPLVVGFGEDGYFIASDIAAILHYTRDIKVLEDGEIAVITVDGADFFSTNGRAVKRDIRRIQWDAAAAEKSGFPHFMLKEIHEQPQAIESTLAGQNILSDGSVIFPDRGLSATQLAGISRISMVACGTSWHAALVGKYIIEGLARVPADVDIASEFRYRGPILDSRALAIAISQSGETADTLGAVAEARTRGARVLSICNVVDSSMSRDADSVIYTHAGPEIGVASTKTFTCQLVALTLFAISLARARNALSAQDALKLVAGLQRIPRLIDGLLARSHEIEALAQKFHEHRDFLFLGRGAQYPLALEGALKLKEISYVHAEGYPAGEMKHGPIALIDANMPVVVICPRDRLHEKVLGTIEEVKAREGIVIALANENDESVTARADHVFQVPELPEFLMPILMAVPLQLLAYHVAVLRGCDVDRPRNLAKSVTVE